MRKEVSTALVGTLHACMSRRKRSPSTVGTNRRKPTVLLGFKTSLRDLVDRLDRAQPHFIRCLKPNAEKVR